MSGSPDLLFDLDGTLTDNFAGIAASIRHALACLNAPPADDCDLRTCVGPPLRATFARLLATADPTAIERAVAHYRERFADTGWRENTPYPGVGAALARLQADGARMFVCTAKPQVYAERIVAHFSLRPYFACVYGADLAGRFDDKAALMAHLIEREGVTAASAIMIGDRSHDIRAARANGARAVAVLWGYGTADELAGADATAREPAELPGILAGLRA